MKRFGYLTVLLLLLSSSADASSISFMFHGQRVRVERPRHCFSRSCVSVIAPGLHGTHQDNGADDMAATPAKPAPAIPAPPPAQPVLVPPPAKSPAVELAANPPRESLRPPSSVETTPVTAQAPPAATPQQATSEPGDTALGDWQNETDKGLVRIEPCGSALCGYTIDASTNAKGETILINMKPKNTEPKTAPKSEGATEWTGTIVSRTSGGARYATMVIKQSNTLRVESCAVGRFFCSGNDWSRIATTPQALISTRQATAQPPS